jgi:hypothetical protein
MEKGTQDEVWLSIKKDRKNSKCIEMEMDSNIINSTILYDSACTLYKLW